MVDDRATLEQSVCLALDAVATASGLPLPLGGAIQVFLEREATKARQVLLDEIAKGKVSASHVNDPANLGGYVLRLMRAVEKGTASRNLQLMARYLLGAGSSTRMFDEAMEDVSILESLYEHELKCIAIGKAAIQNGELIVVEDDEETSTVSDYSKLSFQDVPSLGHFSSKAAFVDALASLQRFGFVRLLPGFDAGSIRATPRLLRFIARIDLDGIVI
jgi:hypothetical protein